MNDLDVKVCINNSGKKENLEKIIDEEFERALESERFDDFNGNAKNIRSKSTNMRRDTLSASA